MITLNTKDLSVGYENKIIVKDININIVKGETLCLLGPNGAGKTTILRTISKLLKPIKGMVYIEEENIKDISNKELSKKMSVVLTNKFNGGLMTVFNVVAMGRYPYTGFFGYLGKKDMEKISEALKIVHAEDIKEAYFDELSDGQKQKVLVARALVQEPDIIVLDEPTTHLDIKHRLELIEILRNLTKQRGITVILSLHEIDMALKSCDKVALVNKGEIVAYGTPEDVVDEDTIEKLYGIKEANFNNLLGSIELSNNNKPKAFVIGGSGYGASIYRILTKYNIGFYTGVLHENDVDYEIARTIGLPILKEKAFEGIKDESIKKAKEMIDEVSFVIDSAYPVGYINKSNLQLIFYALSKAKKVFSFRKKDECIKLYGKESKNIECIDCMYTLLEKFIIK
ncbi:iron complex transport system ATP-binding protein [Clostridium tetanomorphum]|uniref:ABC transporter ATP-binding protein n=1 Tax=Clostridium tetanomorphum TaxID=1553 RepID=A0A923ECH5_CLOTT|nr:ABC transporter ATP-binding protein [Clostridium tetanomorphum]KAJ52358.1 ferric enterobactin transport ATP-binding protein fepC [Clostridium tetanomorphum DSM 665]MBC2397878.1 ABC transporter ATP-binding protein [Clostridium tetanomorphum]MBP1864807.1 iron complex transport system ATP-binding protein [Clostridium tetanomorphum]NRS83983.1 iron complex transport system ATP-binding protein [Clostridium tetanomorphum]NRZ97201.1 iron complex transport system ATP-binding protein [Clostridium tet